MVSNGEYLPNPQTAEQKQVERRIYELSNIAARRQGVSRRQFLAGTGGFAVSFLAMNEAHGAEYFKVSKDEIFDRDARGHHSPPRDLFVFDDQLHTIRSSRGGPGNVLRDIAEGNHSALNPTDLPDELGGINTPWNPALVGLPNLNSNFHLVQFMKDVYLDAQVTIGVLSNNTSAAVPDQGTPRAAEEHQGIGGRRVPLRDPDRLGARLGQRHRRLHPDARPRTALSRSGEHGGPGLRRLPPLADREPATRLVEGLHLGELGQAGQRSRTA